MEKQTNFFQSNTAKIIMVGFLTLILLIPLQFVKSLIEERSIRQKEVVSETSEKWGEEIYFYGPILKIPYKVHTESLQYEAKTNQHVKTISTEIRLAYFFPEELKNTTDVTMVKPLQRSLYKSNVFNAQMDFSGSYVFPNFKINSIADENIMWDKATILIRTTN
ncbi:MAG: cell envelope integrity protein CreD, partial [Bacteroidetes bacterium HGW-Bacteroidetes-23]